MTIRIGIMGLGTVGGGVVKLIRQRQEVIKTLLGIDLQIAKIFSRRDHRLAELDIDKSLFTKNFDQFIQTPMDIVVEVIGGDAPIPFIHTALEKGMKVVTANKSLLATRAREFLGGPHSAHLFYEASCCGGIPIISAFEEGLTGNRVQSVVGILNGTSNYILTEMDQKKADFNSVLKTAQDIGYAEADPTYDIEGIDASHKLCLLASLAFQRPVSFDLIQSEGITNLELEDFAWAEENGYKIRLISLAQNGSADELFLGTFPALLPLSHPLSSVQGAYNSVFLEADPVGELMFYGPGAGEMPTASAIFSDIIAACQNRQRQWSQAVYQNESNGDEVISNPEFPFYLRFRTEDRVGLLAKLCSEFGSRGISLKFVLQKTLPNNQAELVFTTHPRTLTILNETIQSLIKNKLIISKPLVMRILEI